MKTYHSSAGVPARLTDHALWLQHRYYGAWVTVCQLRASDARQLLRWLDHHPECLTLRVMVEALGER